MRVGCYYAFKGRPRRSTPFRCRPKPLRRPRRARRSHWTARVRKQLEWAEGEPCSRSASQPWWPSWQASWPEASATADRSAGIQVLYHPVNTSAQPGNIVRLDIRKHPDPQLIAAKLAVRLRVDDAVGAQNPRDGRGVHTLEVDGGYHW